MNEQCALTSIDQRLCHMLDSERAWVKAWLLRIAGKPSSSFLQPRPSDEELAPAEDRERVYGGFRGMHFSAPSTELREVVVRLSMLRNDVSLLTRVIDGSEAGEAEGEGTEDIIFVSPDRLEALKLEQALLEK